MFAAIAASSLGFACSALAEPSPGGTTVLGPFTGHFAPLHPDNATPRRIEYYGTDLGWTYEHGGRIQFLFGDTHRVAGEPISRTHDDAFGSIALAEWPDSARIGPGTVPTIRFVQKEETAELAGLDPGHPMEGLKTPVAGFSNGSREFALFITAKPEACRTDADCSSGLTCDTELGFVGVAAQKEEGLTFACARSWPGCTAGTISDSQSQPDARSGFCSDRTSTLSSGTDFGRVAAVGTKHIFGVRTGLDAGTYDHTRRWLTNKFINVATRTVADFVPGRASRAQDYRAATGSKANERVFLWGRPHFVGVNARGATLGLHFAYADMPAAPDFSWSVRYYAGTDADGTARFSADERDAVAVDLDSTLEGVQPQEIHDIVQHMSIVWIERLQKWVMLYGGGVTKHPIPSIAPNCGVLEVFARTECRNVVVGNGAVRLRTADDPWGPWTPPRDVIVGGDADVRPVTDQHASGGVLYHPACTGEKCQTPSSHLPKDDYGWLYGVNIIEQWTQPAGAGVDVIWNASTWDPYRVILLRTRINP